MSLVNYIVALIGGFALITWGADRFVLGASATARNFGVSPLLIGLTIVGLGTSAPEILIAVEASLKGTTDMALGNAVGSNITNILLVLGVTALVIPITIRSEILKREFPILFAVMALFYFLVFDGYMSFRDGIILIVGLLIMVIWMVRLGITQYKQDPMADEFEAEIPKGMSNKLALFWLFTGMVVLILSSKLLVWGASNIAEAMGVSKLVIGLTIVALGTSMPELAASVMSALRNEPEIAIGNIIGSNMFNILAVASMPGLIHPAIIPPELINRDVTIMIIVTIALFAMSYGFRGPGRITRLEGGILLGGFIAYQVMLYFAQATS
ncbi:Inner membrane protein YrbG, predicted calcium/sodium:proton antiporter [hydrothermal vent metagenome]|uniref:Inner membrane protein YrbG, predicted calcium/sodium:proton antiporter n=1 Tax=hydrothermal vent metagenome TaxID=652676 RepID=A0A3B0Y742_9ZZZZ